MRSRLKTRKLAGALVAVALAAGGCTNDFAKTGTADVILLMVSINGGSPYDSDVTDFNADTGNGGPVRDLVDVVLAARSKNPSQNVTVYTRAIILERYEVRYFRTDGRNTEGVDVPYRFAGNITGALDIGDSDKNIVLPVEVVRLAAKLEPPLLNLTVGGGAIVMSVMAEVTVYGRSIASGDVVKAVGHVQINFSDYAED
jgi:hypothetical protein